MNKIIQTFSSGQAYLNCQMKWSWRNRYKLVPNNKSEAFIFGDLGHQCLERHHDSYTFTWPDVQELIKHKCACPDPSNAELFRTYKVREAKAIGMMYGYIAHYPGALKEPFDIVSLEEVFSGRLINPATGYASKKIKFAGKIDGLVQKKDGSYWILEHKTCSRLDEDYIMSLWSKIQTQIYAYYIEQKYGITIRGTIYNLLQKNDLKHGNISETGEEYKVRYAKACASNKSGKSTSKQKVVEDFDDYTERCIKWHTPDKYHREEVMFDLRLRETMLQHIHEIGQMMLYSARTGAYIKNDDCCGRYSKSPCEYVRLCQAGVNWQNEVCDYYHVEEPNSELIELKQVEQKAEQDEMPF